MRRNRDLRVTVCPITSTKRQPHWQAARMTYGIEFRPAR